MAEFKLGRIKFVYQGAWTAGNSYVVDDVVTNGGKTYICIVSNTASSLFTTDLNNVTPYWSLIADGLSWKGTWTNSTYYNLGDLAQYGGIVYQCTTPHTSASSTATLTATAATANGTTATITFAALSSNIQPFLVGASITVSGFTAQTAFNGTFTVTACTSTTVSYALAQTLTGTVMGTVSGTGVLGLEVNQSSWTAFATNLNWLGTWTANTRYKVEDFVYYGGVTYVCNTAHVSANTSALGLEANQSDWSVFNAGLNYVGSWATSTRYKLNDIVKYGADLWICTTAHTSSGSTINGSDFAVFVNGFEFENSYNSGTAYIVGDVVTYGGYTYTCIQNGTGQTPSTSSTYWKPLTTGISYVGAWNSSTAYKIGQAITLGAYSYIATADNTNSQPPSSNWSQLNSGIRWNAAPQTTYSGVASTNLSSTSGSGTATFNVTLTGTSYAVTVASGGTGYATNDTLTISGTNLSGTVANNLVVKVTAQSSGVITTVSIVSGYASTWQAGIVYVAGDAVYYGNSSFICINAHIGASGNNPIADTTATYWNLLAGGADSGVLTTTGDLVYYGATGPTRLPIGTDGQVLRVNGNVPAWEYYGLLNNVVYVAQNGVDVSGNGQGLTLDKPWASLLFACKQIEDGYLNTNAGLALKINKQFMLKEVQNYILTQYSFNVTGTSSSGNTFIVGGSSTSSQTTTANMYYGMPIIFSGATGGITPGTVYYVNTIPSSTTFTVSTSYKSGVTLGITSSSSTASIATFSYTQSKAERDAGTLIDCVIFDLTHGGNLYNYNAVQQFFATLTSYITNNATYEMTVWVASLNYLNNTLFASVLTNSAPSTNYQSLQGVPTAQRAVQNTTEVATANIESGSLVTAQGLLSITINALSAGTYANIPQLQRPHTSIYLKTGTYNEYGPIVVPMDTAILGDELRSTIVQAATAQPYLANDKTRTVAALQRIQSNLPAIVNNIPVATATGLTGYTQSYINNTAPNYSTATQSFINNTTLIQNILANGLSYSPVFGSPNTTTVAGMTLSSTQYGTLTAGTGGTFTFGTPLTSGILYTGQYVTVTGTLGGVGTWSGYSSGNTYVISATNGTSTFTLTAVGGLAQTTTAGAITGLSFTQNLSVPNTGTYTLSTPTGFGSTLTNSAYACSGNSTGATTGYDTGVVAIQNNIAFIQTEIAAYMYANYNSVWAAMGATYQAQTLRDVSYLLNSVIYDMTYGGNSQSQIDGLAYYSLGTSSITSTYQASTNAMLTRIQSIISNIVTGTAISKTTGNTATQNTSSTGSTNAGTFANQCIGTVISVFSSGTNANTNSQSEGSITGSTVTLPYYGWATQLQQNAFAAIQAQKPYIQQQIQNYVATTYPNIVSNLALTYRDAGTIVDALSYDMILGTNYFSMVSGRAFYRYVTSAQNLVGSAELSATEASINYIEYLLTSIHTNNSTLPPLTGDLGNLAAVQLVVNNTAIIQNMFANGLAITSGVSNNTNYGANLGIVQEPAFVIPSLGNNTTSTSFLYQYNYGVTQIQNNYQFIKDEIANYLNDNLSGTTWASYGPTYQAETIRDLSNILDALCYDMTYGCNDQSMIAGRAFYSLNTALIVSPYTTGVLSALTRLYNIIGNIVTATSVTASNGNTTSQSTSGTAGSAAAGAFAQARVNDVIYWLNNGVQNTTVAVGTATFSGTSMIVSAVSTTGFAVGQCVTGTVLTTTATSVNGSTGVVTLQSATGLASGMAITFSTPYTYGNQFAFGGLKQTTYTINAVSGNTITLYTYGTTTAPSLTTATGLMTAVAGVAPGTYITSIGSATGGTGTYTISVSQTISSGITVNGNATISPITSGAISFATPANQASFNAINSRFTEIQADAQGWVTKFFQNESPSLTLTYRDAGYIITALSYDVLFASNFYSIINGRAFNRLIPLIAALQANYADSTYGAIGFIGERVKLLAANGSVAQTSAVIDEMVATIYGQPTNNVTFNGTVTGTQLTVNSITSGVLASGMTLAGIGVTYGTQMLSGATTTLSTVAITSTTGVFSCATLTTPLVVGQTVTITGTFSAGSISGYASGNVYYVIGNPTTTAFQLSATQGGTNITTTTSGGTITGITVVASPTTWLLNYSSSVSSTTTSISGVIPTTNYIIMGTTAGMVPGLQVTISGTAISNLTAGTYYVKQVLSTTLLTLSSTYNGSVFAITPNNTLSGVVCTGANGTFTCNAVSSTLVVGQSVTVSGTLSGISMSTSTGTYSSTTTVYYIIATNGSTSFTLSTSAGGSAIVTTAGTPSGVTFTNGTLGSMIGVVYGIYNGLGLTTNLTASGTGIPVTGVTTGTNLITVNSNAGIYPNMPVVFSGLPSPITTTAISTTTSTNVITLAASASSLGIVAGQRIYFTGMMIGTVVFNQNYYVINPSGSTIQISNTLGGSAVSLTSSPTLSSVSITGTAGQFSCTSYSAGLNVGQAITINGTLSSGTINGSATVTATTFYIIATNGSTTFTLSATLGGTAISTTSGSTITGATFGVNAQMNVFVNAAGGLVNGDIYWVNSVTAGTYPNAGTTVTVTNSYKSDSVFAITNTLTGLTATGTFGLATSQGTPKQIINGTIAPGYTITTNSLLGGNSVSYASATGYNNTLTTITGGELIRLNKTFLAADAVQFVQNTYGGTVTSTASNGTFTTSTPHQLLVGDPVQFGLTGTIFDEVQAGVVYWVLTTPSTTTFTVSLTQPGTGQQSTFSLIGTTGSMSVNYYIITAKANRDAGYHIDGLVYDLGKTGNYKSLRSVQLYNSAQSGSTATDLFHVQNGTGIRNMTLNGMNGSLTIPNQYGTRRVTAGSYVSLDPGFGPNDSSVWAAVRSCYVQNVTNFGNGAVGLKIDAALHNGGNRSILGNDFTQVISDGIGVYCTGHGALTECVSVFNYYCYTAYLTEYGGRIRATNGNSSYGNYGVIAEGIDSYETPIYATLNNRANPAYVTNTVTDAANYVYRLEFENAGNAYTNASPTVSGSGYNVVAIQDEFRDSAVFETRLVDLNNGQGVGGSNYLTISNTAQLGALGSITIANSDTNLSSAYPGMRIQVTAGTGVGQYANIINYNSSTKVANVIRPLFAPLTITTNSTSVFTVSTNTNTLYANQPIYLYTNIGGLTSGTVYYVVGSSLSNNGTTFSLSTTSNGSAATLTATSSTAATMAQSTIVGTTLTIGGTITNTIYVGMLLSGGSVAANTYITAGSGTSWTVSVSQNMASTTLTGTISVPFYEAGWDHVVSGTTIQSVLDATSTYTIEPALAYTSPGFTATAETLPSSATWSGLTYSQGNFVSVASGSTATAYSTNGVTWTSGGVLPSSASWNNVVYGGGQGATATAVVGGLGGSGASLTAVLGTGTTAGQITSITVINGGYNYSTPPSIVITDPSGTGATAVAEVLNGTITVINMTVTGSGYTNPTVTVVTSELSSITANTWGQNYFTAPTTTISAPFTATAWTSSGTATSGSYYYYVDTSVSPNARNYYQAGGSGTFSSTAPTFTNGVYGKSGYGASGVGSSATYGVTLTYVGTLAAATANLTNNGVSSFTITQSGYGYTSAPTITVTDPNAGFLAISSSSTANAYNLPTTLGSSWSANSNVLPASTFTSLAYGNNYFIAVGGSGSAACASMQGAPNTSWTNQSSNIVSNSSGYTNVAYGAGTFLAIGGTVSAYMSSNPTTWSTAGTLSNKTWVGLAYGNGRYVALASDGTIQYNLGVQTAVATGVVPSWSTINNNPLNKSGITTWSNLRYSEGQFFAIATGTTTCATSWDGLNWTINTMSASTSWKGLAFGNPQSSTLGAVPTWVAVSSTSGTIASYIQTGATPLGRTKVVTNQLSEIRMIEPGSGFPRGSITATTYYASTSVTVNSSTSTTITLASAATLFQGQAITFASSFGNVVAGTVYYVYANTTASTSLQISATLNGSAFTVGTGTSLSIVGTVSALSLVTASSTTNLVAYQPIVFNGTSQGGITTGQYYYIVPNSITSTQFQIALTSGGSSFTATTAVISNMTYYASPILTITDPNHVNSAAVTPRIGNGALGNPSFSNRGVGNTTATSSYSGDGYADLYQTGSYINVSGLYSIPKAGANVTFSTIPNTWYKLVQVTNVLGNAGNYTATFQINPALTTLVAPPNGTLITTNLLYSNTRMTGHDFLYIGTGGFTSTNYPNVDPTKAVQANQTLATGGGRVFFTSTDQDGNFNVGNLFGVQQSTGTATLNASAFNLSGLNSLTLGSVSVGVGSATITQFSTDPYFTANSDSVVPTQKAIKSFITAQIGGGQSSLNVNTITSGQIYISGNTISNTNNSQIYVSGKMYFVSVDGAPVALAFFGQK